MGKSFRQRVKKRKQERTKYRRPTISSDSKKKNPANATTAAASQNKPLEQSKASSLLPETLRRSPVLSRYLDPTSNVLVVGDGDFSFGRALCQLRSKYMTPLSAIDNDANTNAEDSNDNSHTGGSLTVTGYDSKSEALRKYANLKSSSNSQSTSKNKKNNHNNTEIEKSLRVIEKQRDATALHSIDATKLNQQLGPDSNSRPHFDVVVFNFPHSGQQRVHINRNLMYDFFQSVKTLFLAQEESHQPSSSKPNPKSKASNGKQKKKPLVRQVHVTIKYQRPYIHWDIQESAKEAGFTMNAAKKFDMALWNSLGYKHQTTVGPQEATSQPQLMASAKAEAKLAQTWIFDFEHDRLDLSKTGGSGVGKNTNGRSTKQQEKIENTPTISKDATVDTKNSKTHPILDDEKEIKTPTTSSTQKNPQSANKDLIDDLVKQRDAARQEKNWAEADRIRDLLQTEYSVVLKDSSAKGTIWSWKKHTEDAASENNLPKKKKRKHQHKPKA